jgi:hypothetical protein
MNLNAALRRYRDDRFTDADVVRCTGLSVRAWRELIKLRAVRTEEAGRGPGRVRICDATTLKRAAMISALNGSGLSLALAGQVAFFLPYHTVLFAVCDPLTILFDQRAPVDANTGQPPRVAEPLTNWFDPDKPAEAEADDWQIDIFDGRFVGVRSGAGNPAVTIFGDLRDDATQFVAWLPLPRRQQLIGGAIGRIAEEVHGEALIRFAAEWEDPSKWPRKLIGRLRQFGYAFEHHEGNTDALCTAADAAVRSPVFKSSINISLALRKTLRRYLNLESAAAEARNGEAS